MNVGAIGAGLFALVWLLFMAAWIAVVIVFLVAFWRTMRAHELLAASVREAVELLRSKTGV